jgi:ABC-type Fe3+-citrate transport system substrate-binding protein
MYHRTQNENGSYNTRCLDCFMTIASCVETKKELAARAAHHICPEKALADLLAKERFGAPPAQIN